MEPKPLLAVSELPCSSSSLSGVKECKWAIWVLRRCKVGPSVTEQNQKGLLGVIEIYDPPEPNGAPGRSGHSGQDDENRNIVTSGVFGCLDF
jgi:hypothetical protein